MLTELFAVNLASTVVENGATTRPASGTVEMLTVHESDGAFPAVRSGADQFHFKDRNPECASEILACIATDGNRWTVVRGAEGSQPVAHARRFYIRQVITKEFLQRLGDGSTPDLTNAVTVYGADRTGELDASDAIMRALDDVVAYLPTGLYRIAKPINVLPGKVLLSFGQAMLLPDRDFQGDAAIELVDGIAQTRIENIILTGRELGAGRDVYGIYAKTTQLSATLSGLQISGFPASGMIASGIDWHVNRVTSRNNFGSGFELNMTDSLFVGCRALQNAKYGFVGYTPEQFIGCYSRDNGMRDVFDSADIR